MKTRYLFPILSLLLSVGCSSGPGALPGGVGAGSAPQVASPQRKAQVLGVSSASLVFVLDGTVLKVYQTSQFTAGNPIQSPVAQYSFPSGHAPKPYARFTASRTWFGGYFITYTDGHGYIIRCSPANGTCGAPGYTYPSNGSPDKRFIGATDTLIDANGNIVVLIPNGGNAWVYTISNFGSSNTMVWQNAANAVQMAIDPFSGQLWLRRAQAGVYALSPHYTSTTGTASIQNQFTSPTPNNPAGFDVNGKEQLWDAGTGSITGSQGTSVVNETNLWSYSTMVTEKQTYTYTNSLGVTVGCDSATDFMGTITTAGVATDNSRVYLTGTNRQGFGVIEYYSDTVGANNVCAAVAPSGQAGYIEDSGLKNPTSITIL